MVSNAPLADLNVEFGERPSLPPFPKATDQHRKAGRHLAGIHRHHLMELTRIGRLINQVEAGLKPAGDLSAQIGAMELMENMRAFGTLCGQGCRVLTFHHDVEEHQIFPQLEAAQHADLTAVVARLRQEHVIVHELLDRLTAAAQTLVAMPSAGQFIETRAVYDQLLAVVRSHFGYEETELEEALGLFASLI